MTGSVARSATEPSSEPTTAPPRSMPTVQPMIVPRASRVTSATGPVRSGPARRGSVARRDEPGTEVATVEHGDADEDARRRG